MNLLRKLIFTLSLSLFLFSCGSSDKAGGVADKFYAAVKSDDFSKIIDLCSEEALEANSKEALIEGMQDIKEKVGKLESYERYGVGTSTNHSVTTTELKYKAKYEKRTLYEKITLKLYGDEFKIIKYASAETEEDLAKF